MSRRDETQRSEAELRTRGGYEQRARAPRWHTRVAPRPLTGQLSNCNAYRSPATYGWRNGELFDGSLTDDAADDYPGFTADVDLFAIAAGFDRSAGVQGGGGGFSNDPREYTLSGGLLAVDRATSDAVDAIYTIREDAVVVLVFGIIHRNEDPVGNQERQNGIARVAAQTGGSTGPLGLDGDDPEDMRPVLEEIVVAAIGAASRLELQEQPITLTLKVATGHPGEAAAEIARSLDDGFDYDPQFNRLTFFGDSAPDEGDDVAVSYRVWRPRQPDLTATSLEVDLDGCPLSMRLTATVENAGSDPAEAGIPVAFYVGDTADPAALIGVVLTEVALAPGESTRVSIEFPIPAGRENEETQFLAVVDDDGTGAGVLAERDETNNEAGIDEITCPLLE